MAGARWGGVAPKRAGMDDTGWLLAAMVAASRSHPPVHGHGRVPAFSSEKAITIIEQELGQPIDKVRHWCIRLLHPPLHLKLLPPHGTAKRLLLSDCPPAPPRHACAALLHL